MISLEFIILLLCIYSATPQYITNVCENDVWRPVCPTDSYLFIYSATLSRTDSTVCNAKGKTFIDSCSIDVLYLLRLMCEERSSCLVHTPNAFLELGLGISDNCEANDLYLTTTWDCINYHNSIPQSDTVESAYGWARICQFGVLNISAAFWGTRDCGLDVSEFLMSKCSESYSDAFCLVENFDGNAKSSGLIDPCPTTEKNLIVNWECSEFPEPWEIISDSEKYNDQLDFVVIGDWGGETHSPYVTTVQHHIAKSMGEIAEKINSEFVVSLGDNFYGEGVSSVNDPRFFSTWKNVFTAPALQTDWFLIAGNHDYFGNVNAQVDFTFSKKNEGNRWQFPSLSYEKIIPVPNSDRTVHMIFLDSFHLTKESHFSRGLKKDFPQDIVARNTAMEWLNRVLTSSTSHWKFLFTHYPMYSAGSHGSRPEIAKLIQPLLEKFKIDLCMSGHDHNLQHIKNKMASWTTEHFVVGGGHNFDLNWENLDSLGSAELVFNHPREMTIKTEKICFPAPWVPVCNLGRINVLRGVYGKTGACGNEIISMSPCSISVTDFLINACNGRSSCIIQENSFSEFDVNNLCPNEAEFSLFLEISYRCEIAEGGFASISVSPVETFVSFFNDDGDLLYQNVLQKIASMEKPKLVFPPVSGERTGQSGDLVPTSTENLFTNFKPFTTVSSAANTKIVDSSDVQNPSFFPVNPIPLSTPGITVSNISPNSENLKCLANHKGKKNFDRACVFPFIYKGKTYTECTTDHSNKPWCATEVDKTGVAQNYGECKCSKNDNAVEDDNAAENDVSRYQPNLLPTGVAIFVGVCVGVVIGAVVVAVVKFVTFRKIEGF